ncbi:hypothetical protein U9M48_021402 [Paspalum notatum var. saurae]|uniref:Replication protein A C-terminal domain-containing protein n=1 Tax=Paspalum notatum var. saurae TaxID=547442 RepID=A0AAQ3WSW8_PASNO
MMFSSQQPDFSPSQFTSSQNAAADSTTPSKARGASGTMPLTVKQIADAHQSGTGDKGAPFVVDGVETANIRLVGMVNGKVEQTTDVSFTLDDGTGRLEFIRWVNDASDSSETAAIQNGMYVAVIGSLKGLQERKRATAFSVRPITDFNEVTLHFIQCVRMHIENSKSKVGSPARTGSSVVALASNGSSEASTPTTSKSNPAPMTIGASGSVTDLHEQVLDIFQEPANIENEHGVHIDEVIKRFKLPEKTIRDAIHYHEDNGNIYSTIDDNHFKSAFTN